MDACDVLGGGGAVAYPQATSTRWGEPYTVIPYPATVLLTVHFYSLDVSFRRSKFQTPL
jgi:tripartite-type tricarboxylate transporter receptor subunit TctC